MNLKHRNNRDGSAPGLDRSGGRPFLQPDETRDPGPRIARALDALAPADEVDDACRTVRESLPEYLQQGVHGEERMPQVRVHLDQCPDCAQALQAVRLVQEDLPAWQSLVPPAASRPRLVLFERAWHWAAALGRRRIPLSTEEQALGRQVAGWILRLPFEPATTFADSPAPSLALEYAISGLPARLLLALDQSHIGTEHRDEWRLRIRLETAAELPRVRAGLGGSQRAGQGWRTLAPGRFSEFRVAKLGPETGWIHLEWLDPNQQVIARVIEIPVDVAEGGPPCR
jgi:hypothetical protein